MRKTLSTLIYLFLALPFMLSALFMISLRGWALDRNFYKKLVSDQRIVTIIKDPSLASLNIDTIEINSVKLNGKALVLAAQKALPAEIILKSASDAVDTAFDRLEGKSDRTMLDLKSLKAALLAKAPVFAAVYAENLPRGSEVKELPASSLDLAVLPSNMSVAKASRLIEDNLGKTIATIPDSMDFERALPARMGESVATFTNMHAIFSRSMVWISLAGAGLWIACAFIYSGTWSGRLGRLGGGLLIPGIVTLSAGALFFLVQGPASTALNHNLSSLSPEAVKALAGWLNDTLGTAMKSFVITGIIAVSAGGALLGAKKPIQDAEEA